MATIYKCAYTVVFDFSVSLHESVRSDFRERSYFLILRQKLVIDFCTFSQWDHFCLGGTLHIYNVFMGYYIIS